MSRRISILLDDPLFDRAEREARRAGRPLGWLVQEAMSRYFGEGMDGSALEPVPSAPLTTGPALARRREIATIMAVNPDYRRR